MPGPNLDSILKLKGSRGDFKQENITDQAGLCEGTPGSRLSIDGGKTGSLGPAFADGITMYMGCVWPQAAHPLSPDLPPLPPWVVVRLPSSSALADTS